MCHSNNLSLTILPNEIWKPIKGYEDLYKVSNLGRIYTSEKSFKFPNGGLCIKEGKIKKPYMDKDGYLRTSLTKEHKQQTFAVHRLVAETFIPNENNYPCIDHINGDRSDNKVINLRWCTWKQNASFDLARENKRKASKLNFAQNPKISKAFNEFCKLRQIEIWQYDLNGKLLNVFPSLMEAEKYSKYVETRCRNREIFYHGGYIWSKHKIKDLSIFPYKSKTASRKVFKENILDNTLTLYKSINEAYKKECTTKYFMIKLCMKGEVFNGYKYSFG